MIKDLWTERRGGVWGRERGREGGREGERGREGGREVDHMMYRRRE